MLINMVTPPIKFTPYAWALLCLGLCSTLSCRPEAPAPEPIDWETPDPLESDAGRVTLHRLNSTEFERTTQDLLLTELALGDTLPADAIGKGFNNNAEAQTVTGLHLETLEIAIDAIIEDALRPPIVSTTTRYEPEDDSWSGGGLDAGIGSYPFDPGISLYHSNSHGTEITIAHTGPYLFRILACHELWGGGDPTQPIIFKVNSEILAQFDVVHGEKGCKTPELYEAEVWLEAGRQQVEIATIGPHVAFDWIELEGPTDADGALPPGRAKLYSCDPAPNDEPDTACIRNILRDFMDEAWRRPVTETELEDIMSIYTLAADSGSDAHEAIQFAVKRTLLSPWFWFRVERPADPSSTESQLLSAHELAARLSYFLWSTQPDPALRAAADDGSLLEDEVLKQHVLRMLADPKSHALVDGFGAQWLGIPELHEATPDLGTYPSFSEELRDAMASEIRDLIRKTLLGDRSMLELLTAETRWLEPILAEHYGLTLTEPGYATVPNRLGGGLLTSAGFLTLSSNPNRTSPVRRGFWVASNILCEEPPPPPDGVEQEFDQTEGADTVAAQLAAHRANPACAGCHDQLDPIGLALEGFDGVGLFRDTYPNGQIIETAGDLVGVGPFGNATELAAALAAQTKTHRCMVQKAFTYALGRGTRGEDWPFIQPVEQAFVASDYRFSDLVIGIVQSDLFRTHRGEDQ